MKKGLIVIIILFYSISVYSQLFCEKDFNRRIELSAFPKMFRSIFKDPITFHKDYLYAITAEQTVIAYPFKKINLGIGLRYTHIHYWSNYNKSEPMNDLGLTVKYFLPVSLNFKPFKRSSFYIEFTTSYTDYSIEDNILVNIEEKYNTLYIIPVGLKLQNYKRFNLDFSFVYLHLSGIGDFAGRVGITYNLNFKR